MSLESRPCRRVRHGLIKSNSHHTLDRLVEMSNKLASTLASMHDLMVGMTKHLDQLESSHREPSSVMVGLDETLPLSSQATQVPPPGVSYGAPFQLSSQFETAPPHATVVPSTPSRTIPDIDDVRLTN